MQFTPRAGFFSDTYNNMELEKYNCSILQVCVFFFVMFKIRKLTTFLFNNLKIDFLETQCFSFNHVSCKKENCDQSN